LAEFHEWLLEINIDRNIDPKLTEVDSHATAYLINLCRSHIQGRETFVNGEYENTWTRMKATHKCDIAGITNEYSKMWIEMLMTIPGVSEEKAIVVVSKYPSIKNLMS
jgi:hypothetical protein